MQQASALQNTELANIILASIALPNIVSDSRYFKSDQLHFFTEFIYHQNASVEGQDEGERSREEGAQEGVHGEQGQGADGRTPGPRTPFPLHRRLRLPQDEAKGGALIISILYVTKHIPKVHLTNC